MAKTLELNTGMNWGQKILHLNWGLIALIAMIAAVGALSLFSAGSGSAGIWALPHIQRFIVSAGGMIVIAMIDIRFWHKMSYPIYGLGLLMLLFVELMGHIGMGAQRWIDLGFIKLQPSELMKIAVVMALARYFHTAAREDMKRLTFLIPPALMIAVPVTLVMFQPDLGTALMICFAGGAMLFLAGAPLWLFGLGGTLAAASIPVVWHFLHDYQKRRVMTFLDPESDPLGAGYHITQSKIALGSGGIEGKGFMQGTQSHLNFLPEKQTDFIFTLWAEEWGLVGGVFLLVLFGLVFLYGIWIAMKCRHSYGWLLAMGVTINFSLYVFINIAMVMGLIPVVGAPLPLVSYGGTAMMATMAGFGLLMCCSLHRDAKLPKL